MHNPLLSESFNPIEYINDTFKTSTEYDLNDTLVSLHKSINSTKLKSKQLVASHFSQFVQCKSVIDNVYSDIKLKHIALHHYSTDNILNLLSSLPTKHIDLNIKLSTSLESSNTHLHNASTSQNILPDFMLSKLSKSLENKDYKTFISLYPKHIQHPIKIAFLDSLQSDIHHTKSLSTLLKLFKYYFIIEPTTFPYQTISNTLLVNFKECINSIGKGYTDSNSISNTDNIYDTDNTIITDNTDNTILYANTHFTNTDIFKVTLYLKNIIKKVSATNKEPDFTNTISILVNEYINFIKYIIYKEIGNEYNNVSDRYEIIDSTIILNKNSIDSTQISTNSSVETNTYNANTSNTNYYNDIDNPNPSLTPNSCINNISQNNLPVTSNSILKVLTYINKILNTYKYETMDIEDIKRQMLLKEWHGSIYNIPIFVNMYGNSMFKECVIQYIKRVIIKYNECVSEYKEIKGITNTYRDSLSSYNSPNNIPNPTLTLTTCINNTSISYNNKIYYNALLVVYNTYELLNNKNIINIGIKPSLHNTLQQELINLQVSLIIRIIENNKISNSNLYKSDKGVISSQILTVLYSVNFVESSIIEIVKNKYKEYI